MRYACYRVLYGEDFIEESVRSIYNHVDKIFVFWTNKVLGGATWCLYKGQKIEFPEKFDNVIERLKKLQKSGFENLILIEDYVENNMNQFTHLVNDIVLPKYIKHSI